MSEAFKSTGRTVMDKERTNSITPPLKDRDGTLKRMFCRTSVFKGPSLSEGGLYQANIAMRQSVSQSMGGVHRQSAMASGIIYHASLQPDDLKSTLRPPCAKLCSVEQISDARRISVDTRSSGEPCTNQPSRRLYQAACNRGNPNAWVVSQA